MEQNPYRELYQHAGAARDATDGDLWTLLKLPRYLRVLEESLFRDSLIHGARVLELGAGDGELAVHVIAEHGPRLAQYVATEICAEALPLAQARGRQCDPQQLVFDAVQADAQSLPFVAQSFDWVLAVDLLHHVRHPRRVAAEMARVARQGLCVIEANAWSLGRRALEFALPKYRQRGERSFYPRQLRDLFAERLPGWRLVRLRPFLFVIPHAPAKLLPLWTRLSAGLERAPVLRWQCTGLEMVWQCDPPGLRPSPGPEPNL
jgi:SAM-dependent methyltransferase